MCTVQVSSVNDVSDDVDDVTTSRDQWAHVAEQCPLAS